MAVMKNHKEVSENIKLKLILTPNRRQIIFLSPHEHQNNKQYTLQNT